MSITLAAIATYLDTLLGSERFPHDQNGIYRPSQRNIRRIGLALEPWTDIAEWVREERLDALFLHRPWRLDRATLPADRGILAYHLAFDLSLTCGYNTRMAQVLHMQDMRPCAFKDGVPLGMLGNVPATTLDSVVTTLTELFGTSPRIVGEENDTLHCIAVVGAMTDGLIRETAAQGVKLYITGQWRSTAQNAVHETGMIVAEIGHMPAEQWGIRALSGLLRERWVGLEVVE